MLQLNRMFPLGVSGIQEDIMRDQRTISARVYEPMIEISRKLKIWWCALIPILNDNNNDDNLYSANFIYVPRHNAQKR